MTSVSWQGHAYELRPSAFHSSCLAEYTGDHRVRYLAEEKKLLGSIEKNVERNVRDAQLLLKDLLEKSNLYGDDGPDFWDWPTFVLDHLVFENAWAGEHKLCFVLHGDTGVVPSDAGGYWRAIFDRGYLVGVRRDFW